MKFGMSQLLFVILILSIEFVSGQTTKPTQSKLPEVKIVRLESAGIQIKVPEDLIVEESSDLLKISTAKGDWEIEILDVGNGKNAGEITVKTYFPRMLSHRIKTRSSGNLPNGMFFSVNGGTGSLKGETMPIKWNAHLIRVSETQSIHIWSVFRNNSEQDRNKMQVYYNIIASIEKF